MAVISGPRKEWRAGEVPAVSVPHVWRVQPRVSLEDAWSIATGNLLSPSEQQIVDPQIFKGQVTLSTSQMPRISLTVERYECSGGRLDNQ